MASLTVKMLRTRLKKEGRSTKGLKDQLADRLLATLRAKEPANKSRGGGGSWGNAAALCPRAGLAAPDAVRGGVALRATALGRLVWRPGRCGVVARPGDAPPRGVLAFCSCTCVSWRSSSASVF